MPIELMCFPHDDKAFGQRVREELDRMTDPTTEDLERLLRDEYPAIKVRARSALAEAAPGIYKTWYAFRDGRVVA